MIRTLRALLIISLIGSLNCVYSMEPGKASVLFQRFKSSLISFVQNPNEQEIRKITSLATEIDTRGTPQEKKQVQQELEQQRKELVPLFGKIVQRAVEDATPLIHRGLQAATAGAITGIGMESAKLLSSTVGTPMALARAGGTGLVGGMLYGIMAGVRTEGSRSKEQGVQQLLEALRQIGARGIATGTPALLIAFGTGQGLEGPITVALVGMVIEGFQIWVGRENLTAFIKESLSEVFLTFEEKKVEPDIITVFPNIRDLQDINISSEPTARAGADSLNKKETELLFLNLFTAATLGALSVFLVNQFMGIGQGVISPSIALGWGASMGILSYLEATFSLSIDTVSRMALIGWMPVFFSALGGLLEERLPATNFELALLRGGTSLLSYYVLSYITSKALAKAGGVKKIGERLKNRAAQAVSEVWPLRHQIADHATGIK